MYGLALCLPSVGQPQGLPVPHEIPKTPKLDAGNFLLCLVFPPFSLGRGWGMGLSKAVGFDRLNQRHHTLLRRYPFTPKNHTGERPFPPRRMCNT